MMMMIVVDLVWTALSVADF